MTIDPRRLAVREGLMFEGACLLATFKRRQKDDGTRHIGNDMELCSYRHGPMDARPCSPRCAAITRHLETVALYIGCEVSDFYPTKKPRKGRGA